MYVRCYSTWADPDTQEQLWLAVQGKGWVCAGPIKEQCYFYIPEDRVSWCLLIDPALRPVPKNDYII